MIAFERKYPAFRHLNAGQSEEGTLAQATQKIDREILATIYDLLIRISPDLNPIQSWQIARMMKALYKGMSYLIQQEKEITKDGGDIDNMISDMKRIMADYLEHHLRCL
jgi:hypothetical protein